MARLRHANHIKRICLSHNSVVYSGMHIKEINIKSLVVEEVDMRDYPDFCDAFFSYAETVDGRELSDAELESLTLDNPELVLEAAHQTLY
jgi:uncharacterized lipoprotein YddW (UPF0748 family)